MSVGSNSSRANKVAQGKPRSSCQLLLRGIPCLGQPPKYRKFARKTMGSQRPMKKQQAIEAKRRNSDPDVIVIESSSDESVAQKAVRKPRPTQNLITRRVVSDVSKRPASSLLFFIFI